MRTALIIVSLLGLSAVIGAIIVGRSTFDGTVVDRPYERGLEYDAVQKERAASGWSVKIVTPSFRMGRNVLVIEVTDRLGLPLEADGLSVTISRPSSAAYDRTYAALRTDAGRFSTEINLPLFGYWDARMQVTQEHKTISFEHRIFADEGKK
jgi:nitrogen fixation protein FixH